MRQEVGIGALMMMSDENSVISKIEHAFSKSTLEHEHWARPVHHDILKIAY
jgi:hypothetical protein